MALIAGALLADVEREEDGVSIVPPQITQGPVVVTDKGASS